MSTSKKSLTGWSVSGSAVSRSVTQTAGRMTEADLQRTVCEMLTLFGWRWAHFRPARTEKGWRTAMSGHPGFPDIVAVRGQVGDASIKFIELKGPKGRLTKDQCAWLAMLNNAGGESYTPYGAKTHVWFPSDLESGLIEAELR